MIKRSSLMLLGIAVLVGAFSTESHAQVSNNHLSIKVGGRYGTDKPVTLKGNGNLVIKDLSTGQIIHQFNTDEITVVAGVEKANVGGYAWVEENREEVISIQMVLLLFLTKGQALSKISAY